MLFLLLLLIHYFVVHGSSPQQQCRSCDLYLTHSLMKNAGRAVVAGRDFHAKEYLEASPTLAVRTEHIQDWQLFNYVYASEDEDYSLAMFGSGMLFNHRTSGNVEHFWQDKTVTEVKEQVESHTTYTPTLSKVMEPVHAGEELLTNYGGPDWFEARGLVMSTSSSSTNTSTLTNSSTTATTTTTAASTNHESTLTCSQAAVGAHCLTDVFVSSSTLAWAGKGLFASRNYTAGEVVTISPVLVLPTVELAVTASDSVLINYCISSPGSAISLLPIGLAAMINHQPFQRANVAWRWSSWFNPNIEQSLQQPVETLLDSPFAPLDIEYVATRDIAEGEELTSFYGGQWIEAWATYLAHRLVFETRADKAAATTDVPIPVFRSPMIAAPHLFPIHWILALE